jgi:hypothetical protein
MSGFSVSTLSYIFGEEIEITETDNTTAQTSTINLIVAMNKVIQTESYKSIIITIRFPHRNNKGIIMTSIIHPPFSLQVLYILFEICVQFIKHGKITRRDFWDICIKNSIFSPIVY